MIENGQVREKTTIQLVHHRLHLQDVTNDADTPHVGGKADRIKIHDFRGDEFGGAEQDLHLLLGIEFAGEAKVNYLDAIAGLGETHNVLWLEIQVHNMIAVDELERLADLPHKHDTGTFGQYEVIANDAVEEFSSFNSGKSVSLENLMEFRGEVQIIIIIPILWKV